MKVKIVEEETETKPTPVVKQSYIDNQYDLFNNEHNNIIKEK